MSPHPSLPSTLPDSDGPLVSVVVPTYEDAEYIGGALESIADQTHTPVEAIIVDSSGVDWLESLAMETDWCRYVFQEPSGLSAARNYGIELAEGEYVGFLDADDEWLPEKLERQLEVFKAGADVVYSDAYVIENGDRFRLSSLPIDNPDHHYVNFLYEGGVPIPTVVARRECFESERFDESLPAVEDRHMLARLFYEYQPGRVTEPLVMYNRRSNSMSSDADVMYEAEIAVLDSLFDRYDELAPHRDKLYAKAQYKYGKRLLRTGEKRAARQELIAVIQGGYGDLRTFVLLSVTLLPVRGRRMLRYLERMQERLT